jgi:hypothetical protein
MFLLFLISSEKDRMSSTKFRMYYRIYPETGVREVEILDTMTFQSLFDQLYPDVPIQSPIKNESLHSNNFILQSVFILQGQEVSKDANIKSTLQTSGRVVTFIVGPR